VNTAPERASLQRRSSRLERNWESSALRRGWIDRDAVEQRIADAETRQSRLRAAIEAGSPFRYSLWQLIVCCCRPIRHVGRRFPGRLPVTTGSRWPGSCSCSRLASSEAAARAFGKGLSPLLPVEVAE
jgi:hypothetical protein